MYLSRTDTLQKDQFPWRSTHLSMSSRLQEQTDLLLHFTEKATSKAKVRVKETSNQERVTNENRTSKVKETSIDSKAKEKVHTSTSKAAKEKEKERTSKVEKGKASAKLQA